MPLSLYSINSVSRVSTSFTTNSLCDDNLTLANAKRNFFGNTSI